MQNMILIIENFLEKFVITVTDELAATPATGFRSSIR